MLTEYIKSYDHDHNQNYTNANHAHNQNHTRSQNNVACWQRIGSCECTNHANNQPKSFTQSECIMITAKFIHTAKLCTQPKSMLTESIQSYDHDHNQNYVNADHAHNQNHTRSQNNNALAGKKLGVVIMQIMYTTSQNHSHSQNAS